MPDENVPSPELATKVRRSIFLSQELEASLARLAEERGTTTNALICEILTHGVASLEDTSKQQASATRGREPP
jgi:predicted DNA-binding protein